MQLARHGLEMYSDTDLIGWIVVAEGNMSDYISCP